MAVEIEERTYLLCSDPGFQTFLQRVRRALDDSCSELEAENPYFPSMITKAAETRHQNGIWITFENTVIELDAGDESSCRVHI
jgi:hypothetical protein